MVIINDTAVGTDGNINTGFLVVIISCLCNLDDSRGLSTADALLLTGNADRTAADTDFYKVCAAVCQETEAFRVNYVACANLYGVAVGFTDPFQCILLPFAVALGGVDAQDVYACLYQSGDSFLKVSCVDACADNITLAGIQKLVLVYLVAVIVLTEYHVFQSAFRIYDGQLVDFVVPDDVVCFLQCCAGGCPDELIHGCHEILYLFCAFHAAHAVVSAGYQTNQLALCCAVCGNCNSGVTGSCLQCKNIVQRAFGADVGITDYKACFIGFCSCHHSRLTCDGLRAEDEGNAAFFRQSHCHLVIGYCLHHCRYQRDVHCERRFFPFFEFNNGCFQAYVIHHALLGRIAGYQQKFAEGSGWFCEINCHFSFSSYDSFPILI